MLFHGGYNDPLCLPFKKMSWMSFLFDAITYSDLKCVLYFVKVIVMFCVEIKTFPLVLSHILPVNIYFECFCSLSIIHYQETQIEKRH